MQEKVEEIRQKLAELGKKNLYFLVKGVLFPEPRHGRFKYNNLLHRELAWVIENPNFSKKLIMIPRGHLKSTIGTKGRAIQWVINNPNERILIANATATNAQRFLRHIKSVFEANQLFRWLYPEVIPDFSKTIWSAKEATVRRTQSFPEPTFDTAGLDTALPSKHYTKIIKDDIVNDINTNTPELIEQVIEWDASTIPLFDNPEDPSNEELVIGTPWSNVDVYSVKRNDPDYAIYIRHALETDGKPDFDNGQPIYPERYPREKLIRIRQKLANDDLFFCQYMCDPYGGSNADFKREYIKYYDKPPDNLAISITVDPGGWGQNSDFTAFTVVGVDTYNDWYVLHIIKQRMNPREIIETMFQLMEMYPSTHTIGIETVAWQKALKFFAQEEMRKRNKWLPIRELKPDTRIKKEIRIKGLIPRFSNGTIFLKRTMKALEDELFERVKNDDLKDALAYQLQVATITPQPRIGLDQPDPFSIEAILYELGRKNSPLKPALERAISEMYVSPRWTNEQLEEAHA